MQFLRDRRAAVAPIFALTAIPMIVATGAVIDYERAYRQRTVIQDSLDSAALAAGKQIGILTDAQVKTEASNFYNTNVSTKVDIKPPLATNITASTITLTTTLHVPTYFLGLIGLKEFVFDMKSVSTQAMGSLEVALVLDNSTSMAGSKISTLKTAANNLVTTLFNLASTSTKVDPIKVALVPFGAAVNVGSSATWIDKVGNATYAGDAQEANGAAALNPYSYFSTLKDESGNAVGWGGCVEERPAPYDVQDDPPSASASPSAEEKKTLFAPMFAPDEPDNWTCSTGSCDYLPTSGSTNSNRRYNGAPDGNQSYNNYLPDVPTATFTVTKAVPAVFTSNGHGLTAGTELSLTTTGSLYTGLAQNTSYYVAAYGLTANNFYLSATSGSNTVTIAPATVNAITSITKASPGVVTDTSHGLSANTAIIFSTSGTLPAPLTAGTTYYVKTVQSTSKFTVSATSGGTAINTTTAGSGTHNWYLAAPTVFTKNNHGFTVGDPIVFSTTGSLPSGVSANTVYYVKTIPTSNTFTISATPTGAGIVALGSQSGTQSYVELIGTSGTQSGTHRYTFPKDWTCQSGNAGCGGAGVGESEANAFAGISVAGMPQAKYGTTTNKATIADISLSSFPGGPNFMCTTNPLTPLTVTKATVTNAINAEAANGYTNITSGLMWGWRVLSPGAPFSEGRLYTDTDNQKILVLMTDGANTYLTNSKMLSSLYSAWGYISQNHLGTTSNNDSDVVGKMEGRMSQACTNIKAAGVKIYTIAFQIDDATTKALLTACATDTSKAFQSDDNASLLAAFSAIGDDISLLRLSQ